MPGWWPAAPAAPPHRAPPAAQCTWHCMGGGTQYRYRYSGWWVGGGLNVNPPTHTRPHPPHPPHTTPHLMKSMMRSRSASGTRRFFSINCRHRKKVKREAPPLSVGHELWAAAAAAARRKACCDQQAVHCALDAYNQYPPHPPTSLSLYSYHSQPASQHVPRTRGAEPALLACPNTSLPS